MMVVDGEDDDFGSCNLPFSINPPSPTSKGPNPRRRMSFSAAGCVSPFFSSFRSALQPDIKSGSVPLAAASKLARCSEQHQVKWSCAFCVLFSFSSVPAPLFSLHSGPR